MKGQQQTEQYQRDKQNQSRPNSAIGADTNLSAHPIIDLQRVVGNRAVGQMIQAKLKISQPEVHPKFAANNDANIVQRIDSHDIVGNTMSATGNSNSRTLEIDERSQRRVYERLAELEGNDPIVAGQAFQAMDPLVRATALEAAVSRFQRSTQGATIINEIRDDNDTMRPDHSRFYDPPRKNRQSKLTAPRAEYTENAVRLNDVTMQALANAWPQTIFGRLMTESQAYEVLMRLVRKRGLPFNSSDVNVVGMRAYQGGAIHDNGEGSSHRPFTVQNRYDDTTFILSERSGSPQVIQSRATVDPGTPTSWVFMVAPDQQWDYTGDTRGTSKKYDRPLYWLAEPMQVRRGRYSRQHSEEIEAVRAGVGGRLIRRPNRHLEENRSLEENTHLEYDRLGDPNNSARVVSALHSGGKGRASGEQTGGDSTGCTVIHGAWYAHFNESIRRALGEGRVRFTYSLIDPRLFGPSEIQEIIDGVVPPRRTPVENSLSRRSEGAAALQRQGSDIVFGSGQYRPHHGEGRRLLAHKLTHVLQQGPDMQPTVIGGQSRVPVTASRFQIQRSPRSDKLRDKYAESFKALLAWLAEREIQSAQNDTDLDVELVRLLAGRPDDLWVAQQIRQGKMIENSGSFGPQTMQTPIKVHFVSGTTNRRALVIAGVHGSEIQGIEVAKYLIADLQVRLAAGQNPVFSVIVVPSLFPDNYAARRRERAGGTQTNRNFPDPSQSLATAPRDRAGRPLAAPATRAGDRYRTETPASRPILPENILLMALMERFHPERIISIHGTKRSGAAGVFYDPRHLTQAEINSAREYAAGMANRSVLPEEHDTPEGQQRLQEFERRFFQARLSELSQRARRTDENLSLSTARAIETSTASITGREGRQFANREGEPQPVSSVQVTARQAHPSVAGNVGPSGNLDTAHWSGNSPAGYSLGEYASARGMSIFTVEPPLNCTVDDYKPGGSCEGRAAAVSAAEREVELKAYADAIRTLLLGE